MKKLSIFLVLSPCIGLFLLLTGCPTPGGGGSQTGDISGHARLSGQLSSAGIIISAEKLDSTGRTATVSRALQSKSLVTKALAAQATTDSGGAYRLTGLTAGTYTVYASSQNSLEKAVTTGVTVVAGRDVTAADLNLTPTGQISGCATINGAASGNLGIVVYIAGTSYAAMTDDSGAYTISSVPAGTGYTLVGSKDGYASPMTTVDVTAGATTPATELDLVAAPKGFLLTPTGENMLAVASGPGLVVAAGYGGIKSSNDGVIWTSDDSPSDATTVVYSNGAFYAVVNSDGSLVYRRNSSSATGSGWTALNGGNRVSSSSITSIAYGNGTLVAVDSAGDVAYSGDNGAIWSSPANVLEGALYGVTYGSNGFVAVGGNGTSYVLTSSDGASWSSVYSTTTGAYLYGICDGPNGYIAVGANGLALASPDGASWNEVYSIFNIYQGVDFRSVVYANGLYATVSQTGGTVLLSGDALSWWTDSCLSTYDFTGIAGVPNSKYFVIAQYHVD